MARSVSLDDLREDIRQRCDLPAFSTDTAITTSAVTRMINVSLQAFYARLMEAWGEGYFTTSTTLTALATQPAVNLPSDFLKLVSLHWVRGTDDIVPVQLAQADDYRLASYDARTWTCPKYRLRHDSILLLPTPSDTYTLYIEYVQLPADLSAGSDTFDAGPGWDEWVVLDASRKIFERQQKDAQHFLMGREDVERNVLTLSPHRTETENVVVRDAYSPTGTRELRDWLIGGGL